MESFLNAKEKEYGIEIIERSYADRVTMKIMGDAAVEKKFEEMNKLIVIKM